MIMLWILFFTTLPACFLSVLLSDGFNCTPHVFFFLSLLKKGHDKSDNFCFYIVTLAEPFITFFATVPGLY